MKNTSSLLIRRKAVGESNTSPGPLRRGTASKKKKMMAQAEGVKTVQNRPTHRRLRSENGRQALHQPDEVVARRAPLFQVRQGHQAGLIDATVADSQRHTCQKRLGVCWWGIRKRIAAKVSCQDSFFDGRGMRHGGGWGRTGLGWVGLGV